MRYPEFIGPIRSIVLARAKSEQIREGRAGSGGAVTALLLSGLELGEFDAAVATLMGNGIDLREKADVNSTFR